MSNHTKERHYTGKVSKEKYEHSLDRFIECFEDLVKSEKANDILKGLLSAYSIDLKKANARITELEQQHDELILAAKDMERRISEYEAVIKPILDYGHSRKDLPLGSRIIEEAIKAWKQRDDLLELLSRAREAIRFTGYESTLGQEIGKYLASVEGK